MRESDLDACFDLIEETSGDDYRNSSSGWHPAVKKKEMRSPDLRYILVKADAATGNTEDGEADGRGNDRLCGFMSMMPTFENGEAVVYLYEIHLRPELQG
jgi:N-alpha-acetyltransferase 40